MNERLRARYQDLVARARAALVHAYAPYSDFRVGAAVIDDRGDIHVGVNVENVSYGLTICAERTAIFAAIAAGARRISAIAVTSAKERPISPCGACRQVMAELCDPAVEVVSEDPDGALVVWTVQELLPNAFASSALARGKA